MEKNMGLWHQLKTDSGTAAVVIKRYRKGHNTSNLIAALHSKMTPQTVYYLHNV